MNYDQEQKLLELHDQIYFHKKHKESLEASLDKLEFRYKCIPAKKANYGQDFWWALFPAIFLTVIELALVAFIIWCFVEIAAGRAAKNAILGVGFIPVWLACFLSGYHCVRLWRQIILRFTDLSMVSDTEDLLPRQIQELKEEIHNLEKLIRELQNEVKEIEQTE